VAAVARDSDVSHAAAAPGRLPGRLADARRPAHLRLAGPQLVTERTGFRLILEQRSGHLNDHVLTSLLRVNDHRDVSWPRAPVPVTLVAAEQLTGWQRITSRHYLTFTTTRQGEQGHGRRHVPGLRPPDHVGSQPPVRIPVHGIHPGPGIVPDPSDPAAPRSPRRSRSRSSRRSGGRRRSCGLLRPALGGDHVPRGAMREDLLFAAQV
jgi:hypothetical protein